MTARQTRGFEQAFDRYAADCPHRSSCAPLEQPRRFVEALVKRADADPIPSGRPADTHPLGGKDVLDAVTAGLYDDQLWPVLDDALSEADNGDSGSLSELWDNAWGRTHSDDPHIVDPLDAGYVINCNDRPTGPTDAEIRAAARRLVDENPLFGPRGSAELFACHGWQPHRHVLDEPTAPTRSPIVVVGTLHDPATPYAGAVSLAETLGNAKLLTWEGDGHTAFLQSDCIDEKATEYLLTLRPPDDDRCPA